MGRCSVMKIPNEYSLYLLNCIVRLPITDLKLVFEARYG